MSNVIDIVPLLQKRRELEEEQQRITGVIESAMEHFPWVYGAPAEALWGCTACGEFFYWADIYPFDHVPQCPGDTE